MKPIVLFAYNRPEHTRRTVESLARNDGAAASDLYVFSDGPKGNQQAEAVAAVRTYLREIDGFKTVRIVERERNMGLAASIIAGVSEVLESHSACIVMEDDMLSTPGFLRFMNQALRVYEDRPDIFSVTGYNYPIALPASYPHDVYLARRASSWGWGTWAGRWRKVDWAVKDYPQFLADPKEQAKFALAGSDLPGMLKMQMEGKLDSWAIRFAYAHHKHDAFTLHPVRSKIQNIGFDGSGVHCGVSQDYHVELDSENRAAHLPPDLKANAKVERIFAAQWAVAPPKRKLLSRAVGFARRMLSGG